jgi:crotonobetaine/carnitine-CoA ligase
VGLLLRRLIDPRDVAALPLTRTSTITIGDLLDFGAANHPDRPFVVFEAMDQVVEVYTWSELNARSFALAELLTSIGIRRTDKVNLHLGNRPLFLVAWFACARVGAVMVPTNTASSRDELNYQIEHSEAKVCLVEDQFAGNLRDACRPLAKPPTILVESELETLLAAAPPGRVPPPRGVSPTDVAAILYTSGTTSKPKGVMVSQAAYAYAGEVVRAAVGLLPTDRFLTVLPLFHGNAQYYSVMSSLVAGCTVILCERFSASRYFEQAVRHHATVGSLFAAAARMILAQPREAHRVPNSLRAMVFAQNLSARHLEEWADRFQVPIVQLYGMTETVGPPTFNPMRLPRADSIGLPSLGYTCRIVSDQGRDCADGETGQLLVGGLPGLTLMTGYFKDPAATSEVLRDGWLWTGDIVRADADGYLYFVDRAKDMIKIAGENVAASEVEAAIKLHPDVFDVAVIGAPDEVREERIIAFAVLREGATIGPPEIIEWCRSRLAKFRVPSEIVIRAELPRTSVGKIQKPVLRAEYGAVRTPIA